jgi:predicted dehydrogenase
VSVASASGLSARRMAERAGFEKAVSGADAVIDDPEVEVVVIATSHDSHARFATQALRAGKHVFCEKPLALTMEELDDVEAAQHEGGGVLFVGFNRRYSEPVRLVREHFASGSGPLVITYRVNAGRLPPTHWYHDRRQGGRLLGEVCHFIDTCATLVDLIVGMRYDDGSLATISYASGGHSSTGKERIEVLGRERTAVIVDFREVIIDGRRAAIHSQDKGHLKEVEAFFRALNTGHPDGSAISSSRTALLAAATLLR